MVIGTYWKLMQKQLKKRKKSIENHDHHCVGLNITIVRTMKWIMITIIR